MYLGFESTYIWHSNWPRLCLHGQIPFHPLGEYHLPTDGILEEMQEIGMLTPNGRCQMLPYTDGLAIDSWVARQPIADFGILPENLDCLTMVSIDADLVGMVDLLHESLLTLSQHTFTPVKGSAEAVQILLELHKALFGEEVPFPLNVPQPEKPS